MSEYLRTSFQEWLLPQVFRHTARPILSQSSRKYPRDRKSGESSALARLKRSFVHRRPTRAYVRLSSSES